MRQKRWWQLRTEATSTDPQQAQLVGVAVALQAGRAFYIPLRHTVLKNGDKPTENEGISIIDAAPILRSLLDNPFILKVGHNIKYDLCVLANMGNGLEHVTPIDDTLCLSYILDAGRVHDHNLGALVDRLFSHRMMLLSHKEQDHFAEFNSQLAQFYAEKADFILRAYHQLKARLTKERLHRVHERMERPLVQVLC